MIYILLPVHNRKKITEQFFNSLASQTFNSFHLILVDDGSTDGTSELLLNYNFPSTVIRGDGNLWWGGALQKGYEELLRKNLKSTDAVLIINDDCSLSSNFLEIGSDLLLNNQNSLIQAVAVDPNSGKKEGGVHVDWSTFKFEPSNSKKHINCLSTRGLILTWPSFLRIGGFRPKLLPHYLSDYEFTIRAHKRGLALKTFEEFYLEYNTGTTGVSKLPSGFRKKIKFLFSKKYINNPWYMTVFIFIAAPALKVPRCIFLFWISLFSNQIAKRVKLKS